MSNPTIENIATVMNGFAEFFNHMIQMQNFDLKEFVSFMEPKFKAAGYRDANKLGKGNILILTEIGAGDFIVSTGAIREIRRIYSDARITLVVNPRTAALAEFCPYVDELFLSPQHFSIYNPFDAYRMNAMIAQKLLEERFDVCFAFSIHPHNPLLMYMSGAKVRITAIGAEDCGEFNENKMTNYFAQLSTHFFQENIYGYHRADRFFSLIENIMHLPITNRKLEVWYTPADVSTARSILKVDNDSIYAFSMGGTFPRKHYPPEKYARLIEMILRKEPTAMFVILGGGQYDLTSAEIIKKALPKVYERNIIDLTNKINYRQSAAILSLCRMYIGNDTGTVHIAAAVGCPVLMTNCFPADFPTNRNDTPRRWYPYGVPSVIVQPAHALPECKELKSYDPYGCAAPFPHCITQIKPETLLKGFHLLKERAATKINEPLYIH